MSDDRMVAVVEVVSAGNKSSRNALRQFIEKAAQFLNRGVHLLILDVHAPGPRDPEGIHSEIWEEIAGSREQPQPVKPLTLAAYEANLAIRCFVKHLAVGESLPDMPLFLEPNGQVPAPLQQTYDAAFAAMPRRWRRVLEK